MLLDRDLRVVPAEDALDDDQVILDTVEHLQDFDGLSVVLQVVSRVIVVVRERHKRRTRRDVPRNDGFDALHGREGRG